MTFSVNTQSTNTLNSAAPSNSCSFAEVIALEQFGIRANARPLTCERDQIFMLQDAFGVQYILRFINPAEESLVSNFQTEALLHIERTAPKLPVPTIIMNHDAQAEVMVPIEDGRSCITRLITCVPGIPASKIQNHSKELIRSIGHNLARLDRALLNFTHPGANHNLIWNIERAPSLRNLLVHVQERDVRELAQLALDNFEQHAILEMQNLRHQVIHNDLNFSNVMVDPKSHNQVSGIIDFGDLIRAPLINDVAVSLSFLLGVNDKSLKSAATFVAAFHKVLPLRSEEVDILFDLALARAAMTVVISESRASQFPGNREFILKNNSMARRGLFHFARLGREMGRDLLLAEC